MSLHFINLQQLVNYGWQTSKKINSIIWQLKNYRIYMEKNNKEIKFTEGAQIFILVLICFFCWLLNLFCERNIFLNFKDKR